MLRLKYVWTAPVRTKLAGSANGARERQLQILNGVNTGDGTLYPLLGKNTGFPVYMEAFLTRGYS